MLLTSLVIMFLVKSWPCANGMKRRLLQITSKLNATNFHHFFTVRSMISKCNCTYMSGSELAWIYSQAFIIFSWMYSQAFTLSAVGRQQLQVPPEMRT